MGSLFISYRRDGGSGYAGRLFDAAAQQLGREHVFMDATGIEPGQNFVQSLRAALAQCQAMAVVVTPGWSEVADAEGPRLQREDDWVRVEIETALAMGLRVVPTLVAGARMPAAHALPASLKPFSECQAIDLRDATWDDDVRRLITALRLQPRRNRPVAVAAGIVLTVALLGLVVIVAMPSLRSHGPSQGDTPSKPWALDTLTPTDAQKASLVERYAIRGLNALLLRQFLTSARQRNVPANRLETELELFAFGYGELQRKNLYDDSGIFNAGAGRDPEPKCEDTLTLMRDGNLPAAIAAFEAGASSAMAKQPPRPSQRIYAAWCTWLRGQAELMEDGSQQAASAFDEAIRQSTLAGKEGQRLLYKVLRDSAHLAQQTGPPELAVKRFEQAIEASADANPRAHTELMTELAAFQDGLNQPAAALHWRERAQAVYDAARDPGDKQAQANALRLAQDYEAAHRRADAQALRDRYGLPAAP
ncbi:hypothetical protein BH11PSE8_BH11PSE8_43550 [soil metagenome]